MIPSSFVAEPLSPGVTFRDKDEADKIRAKVRTEMQAIEKKEKEKEREREKCGNRKLTGLLFLSFFFCIFIFFVMIFFVVFR